MIPRETFSPSRAEIGEAGFMRNDVPVPPSSASSLSGGKGNASRQQGQQGCGCQGNPGFSQWVPGCGAQGTHPQVAAYQQILNLLPSIGSPQMLALRQVLHDANVMSGNSSQKAEIKDFIKNQKKSNQKIK